MKALALALAVAALATTGVHLSGATFTAGAKRNPSNTVAAARIFPADRLQSAWSVSDAVSGTAIDKSSSLARPDGTLYTTSAASSAFASNRYMDIDFDSVVPGGITPQSVTFNFDFADDNGDAKTTCFYFEVRRASSGTVLGTYGSAASPVACEPGTTPQQTTTSIASAVTSTTIASDLRIRVFANDAGNNTFRIDQATVSTKAYGKTWTEYPASWTDSFDTSAATSAWGPARSDGSGYQSASNWPTAFSATKYVEFAFPSNLPGSATSVSAKLDDYYSSTTAGANACVYVEVYSGGSLIGSHGSSASPYSCNSTTTANSDEIALPEVTSAALANGLVVRIYGRSSGSAKTSHDLVALKLNYSLGSTGCTDAGTFTIDATRDSWADQNAPTSVTGGTAVTVNAKSQSGSRNRRAFVYYPLPSLGDGCTLQSATLRLYQTVAAGTRTVEVVRATGSWSEATLNWNTQPGSAGTPVGAAATTANAWVTWNVGTLTGELYAGTNNGFLLRDSAEDNATAVENKFNSREATSNTPQLVLTIG